MKYRIMIVVESRPNNSSSYEFYKKRDEEGFIRVFETSDKSVLAEEVEELLNTKGKNEFLIVSVIDYNLDTDIDAEDTDSSTVDDD